MNANATDKAPFRILVVFQDGDDFRLLNELLHKTHPDALTLVWEADWTRSLDVARSGHFDAVLLDDPSGDKSALSFLRESRRKGVTLPQVVVTGRSGPVVSKELLDAGAADCLPRDKVNAFTLARSLECAILHRHTLDLAYDSEERFRILFDTATEAFVLHLGGTILEANPAAALMFGMGTFDMVGMGWIELFTPDSREAVKKQETDPETSTLETIGQRKDGSTFSLSLSSHPFKTRNRNARLLVLDDLTPLKDRDREIQYLLQRLKQDNDKLIQADHIKDEFLSSVTGDLRSPLTTIVGYLKLLKMEGLGPLTQGQRDAVESADKNAKRLHTLVDDLLDLSRLDPGSFPLDFQETPMKVLLETAKAAVVSLASAKSQTLRIETAEGSTILDPAKMGRVLNHLLSNSVKFTPIGGAILLSAQTTRDGQRSGWLIAVRDSGSGIPDSEIERVFDRFYRMDLSASERTGGSGVGLAVSRRIVEAHGGRIWAEGAEGDPGVVFKVFLPQTTA